MSKTIKIACSGAGLMSIVEMTPIQDKFKTLSEDGFNALKKQILEEGFSSPIYIWEDPEDAKIKILDGHQRYFTLLRLRDEEDYSIPLIPVVYIEAENIQQAIRKLSGFASVYGTVNEDELVNLYKKYELDYESIIDKIVIPNTSIESIIEKMKLENQGVTTQVEAHDRTIGKESKTVEDKKEFLILVTCENEAEQSDLYSHLIGDGYSCKLID